MLLIGAFCFYLFFYLDKRASMRDSLFGIAAIVQMEQANVLDTLPDAIIIADTDQPNYVNEEALSLLNSSLELKDCQQREDVGGVKCVDPESGQETTLTKQLVKALTTIDGRLAEVEPENFFKTIIDIATDKAVLLHLHDLGKKQGERSNELDQERENSSFKQMASQHGSERKTINDAIYEVRIKRHFFRGKRQVVIVFQNVSAEKQLEQEKLIREFSRTMFASSSHEFRTPIGSGLNGLELLEFWIPPQARKHFLVVRSSLQFLLMLVNNTLDFAQLESGNFKMSCEDMNLREHVNEVVSLINVIISFKESVVLHIDIPDEIPQNIEMDAQRLKQILINLLKNATKFTFKGFILLRLKRVKLLATRNRKPIGH